MSKNIDISLSDVLGNKAALSIIKTLYLRPGGATGRQIANFIDYSPQSALNALNRLESLFLVTSEQVGRAKWYKVNKDHWFVSECLIPIWNKVDSWPEMIGQYYQEHFTPKPLSIVMYGSNVRGEAAGESDLDLLFIFDDREYSGNMDERIVDLNGEIINKFGRYPSPKSISVSVFQKEVKAKEGFIRNVFREGKSIFGLNLSEVLSYDSKKD